MAIKIDWKKKVLNSAGTTEYKLVKTLPEAAGEFRFVVCNKNAKNAKSTRMCNEYGLDPVGNRIVKNEGVSYRSGPRKYNQTTDYRLTRLEEAVFGRTQA